MTPNMPLPLQLSVCFLAGLLLGAAACGLHETTKMNSDLGIAVTNRLTGAVTFCYIDKEKRPLGYTCD